MLVWDFSFPEFARRVFFFLYCHITFSGAEEAWSDVYGAFLFLCACCHLVVSLSLSLWSLDGMQVW